MALWPRPERALRRESNLADMIPLTAHVDEFVARTSDGHYVQAFRLGGISYESADDADLNNWHERLNVLWRNIASPHLALWTHVMRRRDRTYPDNRCAQGFAADLNRRYRHKVSETTLMVNELVVTLVYRPQPGAVGAAALTLLRKTDPSAQRLELQDALDFCAKKRQELLTALDRYDPQTLTLYTRDDGLVASQLLEFYGLLVNAEAQSLPVPRGPLNQAIATSRPLFGQEAMEYRSPVHTRLGAFLSIKEYRARTLPGVLNGLLMAPFPFVLTQSFTFLPKATALELMGRQLRRLQASGDVAISQADELHCALDDLASNRFVIGDHHLTLQVMTEPVAADDPAPRLKQLNDHVAHARYLLGDAGFVVAREDLALEAAFWSQLPGNFRFRPRKAPITSRNFSAMVPFHNHPTGRATGNRWGNALTMFVTTARSPLFFSLHASDPRAPDGGSRKDVGHLVGIGPTGSGKTTVIAHLIAMLTAFDTTQVVFDHHEGLHILVRALGGQYLALKNGRPTGCNPLQLPDDPATVEFLRQWLRRLVRRHPEEVLSVRQEEDLDHALRGTLSLDLRSRRLSRLIEFLDTTDPEGLHARLKRWCATTQGDYAWAFDNPTDELAPLLQRQSIVGFDASDFLDNPTVRDPMAMTLFHLVDRMVDGRRLVVWADEFARLLSDPSFAQFSRAGLETWRKKEAAFCAFTQSTSHVLDSTIARAVVEQTPTKLFFPNPDADRDEYMGGFNLTEREFLLIKQELEPGSRCFLIKQGHLSTVARLDLQGCDDELAVLSGRAASLPLMHQLIARHGGEPNQWLPAFQAALRAGAATSVPHPHRMELQHA